ncbi:MarR family winged helix-turn-helix transcriptional regulator [Parafrigoribacterium soli]|uniref:MarR family winged helix-turn-helix transcriptional regulator n=1 Tax=Parafrigoribacterium soli TaxID=3144663 RepID=UPI0032EC8B1A
MDRRREHAISNIPINVEAGVADAAALSHDGALVSSDLAHEIEFLAARSRSIGIARANAALVPLALRVRSYSVLALACSEQSPSQRELAEFLVLDPSQIVALVDELEERGLVSRQTNPRDRRSKGVRATEPGRRLYTQARAIVQRAEDESLGTLDDAERRQLRALLRRIAFADQAG